MISAPIRMFFAAAGEVAGRSAEAGLVSRLIDTVRFAIQEQPFTLLDLAAVKTGRSLFAAAYIRPDASHTVQDLDALRASVQRRCEKVTRAVRTEIIYTAAKPFDWTAPPKLKSTVSVF